MRVFVQVTVGQWLISLGLLVIAANHHCWLISIYVNNNFSFSNVTVATFPAPRWCVVSTVGVVMVTSIFATISLFLRQRCMVVDNRVTAAADTVPWVDSRGAELALQGHCLYQETVFVQALHVEVSTIDLEVAYASIFFDRESIKHKLFLPKQ